MCFWKIKYRERPSPLNSGIPPPPPPPPPFGGGGVSKFSFGALVFMSIFFGIYQYRHEVDMMDTFENNVATHLTRILNSSDHSVVISSAR